MRKIMYVLVALVLLVIIIVAVYARTVPPPPDLGVINGRMAPCPESPNCVSSHAVDESQRIVPIAYTGEADAAMKRLHDVVAAMSRAKVITRQPNYLHVEFRSRFFRFVDDVEFLVDPAESVIHVRSASRVGHSDLGVNRSRVEQIRERLGT
jgi:uncharacterized protein (DUF1499 family)